MGYLRSVSAKTKIPTGHVIVHNHVRPTMHLGSRGFRAWTQVPNDSLVLCKCGWAAKEIQVHYRVNHAKAQRIEAQAKAKPKK